MTEYKDRKSEITESEKNVFKRYYKDSRKKLNILKKKENFQSLKERDLQIICAVDMFRHILYIIDKAKDQYKEDFSQDIEDKFLNEIFVTLAEQEYVYVKSNKKDAFIDEYVRKLSKWYKFYVFIYSELNVLFVEFDPKKLNVFKNKSDVLFAKFEKEFSSIEIKEKNFLFSIISVKVMSSLKKKYENENEKLETFSSLLDSIFINRVMS